VTEEVEGDQITRTVARPKSVAYRFLIELLSHLRVRAARAWRKFDSYLDIIASFAIYGPEDLEKDGGILTPPSFDQEGKAYQIGMELFFKNNMITMLGDFVLQEDSPLFDEKEERPKMGMSSTMYSSYSTQPNFGPILRLIMIMISD
jgi:hypothetical protein